MDNTLEIIKRYGLSVRQIPTEIVGIHSPRNRKDGDVDITWNDRPMLQRTTIPRHAGHWMCRQVKNNDSRTEWSTTHDNLAPTLEESVALFASNLTLSPSFVKHWPQVEQ